MVEIYKPTQEELDSDIRSDYCKNASKIRIGLVTQRQMLNRYSNCGYSLPKDYKNQLQDYLDKYMYFELNTIKIIEEKEKNGEEVAWGNKLFSRNEVEKKIKELSNG
jgi:hypothetical protein